MRVSAICFSLLFMVSVTRGQEAQNPLHPMNLRCEYRTNPLGIDAASPRLSWELESADVTARGLGQSSYRVLVASSESALLEERGDLWDSGRVNDDRSIQIPYHGKPLHSGEQVWWKVRVWDLDGNPTGWSAPARWSMGLLNASDWKAKWVGLDQGAAKARELDGAQWISAGSASGAAYFRFSFDVSADNPVSSALLLIVGSGASSLSVNGEKEVQSTGLKSPLSKVITDSVHPGANVVAVSVSPEGNGPAAVIGSVELDLADGSRVMLHTGKQWRATGAETAGWEAKDYNDSSWEPAKELGANGTAPWGEVGFSWRTVLPARLLRKDFSVPAPVRRATLYISGLGVSEAYLNGEKVSQDVLSPALSEYNKRVFYLTYDVTRMIRPGANAVGVMLGNGRYFAPRSDVPTNTRTFGYPKLLLQLEMERADGKVERVCSDETWKLTTEGPIRANNEYDGEYYDARKEVAGWSRPGFASTGWQAAQVVDGPTGVLSAQSIAPIRVRETLKPVALHEVRPGVFVYDMGQNMVGWCRLTVTGPRGTQVTLRHAERLQSNGMLYTDNLRSAEAKDTYILKGQGIEVYEPRFTYHGFRYVELKGFPGKPALGTIEGLEVHDNLESASEFATSNPLLNRIYKAVQWGAKDNYRSIPTDCPQRDERQGWLGDRSGESLGETYLFGLASFYANWVTDMRDAQDADGRISDVSPAYWPLYNDNVTWPASFIMVTSHLYEQYGDVRVIEENYPAMRKWMTHMETYLKDDLMPRDTYGDWCMPPESPELIHSNDPKRKTDATVLGTTYFYRLLRIMSDFAKLLGKADDVEEYELLAARMKTAFTNTYYHAETNQYANGSATSSVLPLAFRMTPNTDGQKIADAMVRKIAEEHQNHVATGLVGGQWLMQTLTDYGYPEVAYDIASQSSYPSWGYMLDHGATTIWELWNGDTANPAMNSGNHLMLVGDLITWLYQNVAGIRTDLAQPGYKHILMRPTPVRGLSWAKASYRSSYGKIVSDWKVTGGRFAWNISVPPNAKATVYIPAQDPALVTESGNPVESANGVKFVRSQEGAAVYEIGSGNYHFESPFVATNKQP